MDAHQHGFLPGLSAPEAASSARPACTPSAAVDAAHAGLNPQKESAPAAQTAQSREQNEHANSATNAAADKAFHSLRAQLALKGYSLHHTSEGIYIVSRWNLSRRMADLGDVEQFMRRVAP